MRNYAYAQQFTYGDIEVALLQLSPSLHNKGVRAPFSSSSFFLLSVLPNKADLYAWAGEGETCKSGKAGAGTEEVP